MKIILYSLTFFDLHFHSFIFFQHYHANVFVQGSEYGMIDMNRTLVDLVRRGEITPENALSHSFRPQLLQKMI